MSKLKKVRSAADPTRRKILKVAQQLFAAKGFAGTSISDIANRARINQSLIYHHFGNKQQLWQLVKSAMLENYFNKNETSFAAWLQADTFVEFVEKYMRGRFEFHDKNPDIQRMINWQRLEPNQDELRGINSLDWQALIKKIAEFQRKDEVNAECEPEMILFLLSTMATSLFSSALNLLHNKTPPQQKKIKAAYFQLIVQCVKSGLLNHQEM